MSLPLSRRGGERKLEAVVAAARELRQTGYSSIALMLRLNQALDRLGSSR